MSCVSSEGYRKGESIRAEGVSTAANIRRVAAVALAIDNASQLISNWKKQRDISDRMLSMSEEKRRFAQEVYWPKELAFIKEFGTPEEVELTEVYGRRFAGHLIAPVAKAFAQVIRQQKCVASRYHTSQFVRVMQTLYQSHATAVTNAKIMGYIMGFAYAQAKKDLNNKRRRQAIGIGRGLFGMAANLYSSAAGGLAAAGSELTAGLNNAMTAFGFAEQYAINSVPPIDSFIRNRDEDGAVFGETGNWRLPSVTASSPSGYNENGWSSTNSPGVSGGGALSSFGMNMNFGSDTAAAEEAVNAMYSTAGDAAIMGDSYNNMRTQQLESGNDAVVGNRDLVRTGSKTYTFTDSDGDRGQITVSMDDFALKFADSVHPTNPGEI